MHEGERRRQAARSSARVRAVQAHLQNARLGLLAAGSFALGGCLLPETAWLPVPPMPPEASTLVLVFEGGGERVVQVLALEDGALGRALQVPVRAWARGIPEAAEVLALVYAEDPWSLELGRGELPPAPAGTIRACSLARPAASHRTELPASASADWRPGPPVLPAELQVHLLGPDPEACRRESRCRTFESEVLELDHPTNVQLLLPLGEERVLGAHFSGEFWETTPGEVRYREDLRGLPARGGHLDEHGRLWLGGEGGRIAHGPLEGPFEHEVIALEHEIVAAFGTITDGGVQQVLALALDVGFESRGVALIERRPDGTWHRFFESRVHRATEDRARVVWASPSVAAVTFGGDMMLLVESGRVRGVKLTDVTPLIDSVTAVTHHPRFGLVAGTHDGRLYRSEPPFRDWASTAAIAVFGAVQVVVADEHGFFYGGEGGVLGQFYPPDDACPPASAANSDAEEIVLFERRIVVSGGNRNHNSNNTVTWLTERTPR